MRIFQICNKSPFPANEGGSIAMNNLTQGLLMQGHTVKILAFSTPKNYVDEQSFPEKYKNNTSIETVFIDNSVKFTDAFFNLFTKNSYHIQRFLSKEFENKIISILQNEKFDIIQLETLYVTPYIETIRQYSDAKIILRSHNVEHLIWQRIKAVSKNIFKKFYLNHLTKTLRNYEINILNKCDGIAAITANDAEYMKNLGCKVPIIDLPIGIDLGNYARNEKPATEIPSLFFIGSMNWMPNEEAIKWFLNDIWDPIVQKFPNLNLYLAGHQMPAWVLNKTYPNTIVVGEVDDAIDFMNSKQIMVVPLLSGSGLRIKIIEGMALGKTVISTTIGAEGIEAKDGLHILIANTPEEFLMQISNCLQNTAFADSIGSHAQEMVIEKYENKAITTKLTLFYNTVLNYKG